MQTPTFRQASKQWSGRSVLVTGATGFVGYWLTERLVRCGAKVTTILADWNPQSLLIRSGLIDEINVRVGSVTDFDFLRRTLATDKVESIFHLAAMAQEGAARESPLNAFETNIRGTYTMLEAARQAADQVHGIVVASSDKAYGSTPALPYIEDMPLDGRHPYDVSKSCADLIAQTYHHTYGLPVVVGRFGNVFGGGDFNWDRLIPGTIRRLHRGERPMMRAPVGGMFRRDFLYVQDAVDVYLAMYQGLATPGVAGQGFNCGLGISLPIAQVIEMINHEMGEYAREPDVHEVAGGEILHQELNTDKARQLLCWTPQHSFEQGLTATVKWYVDYLHSGRLSACVT